jgi:hypothetical protein
MADDDVNEKKPLDYPIGLSLTTPEGHEVAALARGDERTLAAMARVLIREALAARRTAT